MFIVTDTSSDINRAEANELNIKLVALPVTFCDMEYDQFADNNFHEFYRLLQISKTLPKTSQPSPAQYLEIFEEAKERNEDVLVITLSSGLSGTFTSARTAKNMCEYDKIHIIDSMHASISLKMLVHRAVKMRDDGAGIQEIVNEINHARSRVYVCGMLNTLTYLKKGGRVPAAMAFIGNALNIKPIIACIDGKIEPLGKTRGYEAGKKFLYNEFTKTEIDNSWPVYFGYTLEKEKGEAFMAETVKKYNLQDTQLHPIGSVIGTHVGPGGIELAFMRK